MVKWIAGVKIVNSYSIVLLIYSTGTFISTHFTLLRMTAIEVFERFLLLDCGSCFTERLRVPSLDFGVGLLA